MDTVWWKWVADIITIVMAASLFLLGVILIYWPKPRTWVRWQTMVFAFLASGVTFWHVAINHISPHPRIFMSVFVVSLTFSMLKYRATVVAKQDTMHRRVDDD
jgi:hypothetical protein